MQHQESSPLLMTPISTITIRSNFGPSFMHWLKWHIPKKDRFSCSLCFMHTFPLCPICCSLGGHDDKTDDLVYSMASSEVTQKRTALRIDVFKPIPVILKVVNVLGYAMVSIFQPLELPWLWRFCIMDQLQSYSYNRVCGHLIMHVPYVNDCEEFSTTATETQVMLHRNQQQDKCKRSVCAYL